MVIVAIMYFIHHFITKVSSSIWINYGVATLFLLLYGLFVLRVEKKEFQKLPYVGKWI